MSPPHPLRSRTAADASPAVLVVAGLATGIGVLFAVHLSADAALRGTPVPLAGNLLRGLTTWWLWAALTPLMLRAARRIEAMPASRAMRLAAHLLAALLVSVLHDIVYVPLIIYLAWPELVGQVGALLVENLVGNWYGDVFTYGVIVGAWSAWRYAQRWQHGEQEAARLSRTAAELEAALVRTQLDGLRRQLNPHFLFNALNAVSTLVQRGDAPAAGRALGQLGDLLRSTLGLGDVQCIPLREEIALLERYLAIERLRFADRLHVHYDVDAALEDVPVPVLVLQPLVENALVHAVAHRPEGGTITVRVHAERRANSAGMARETTARLLLDVDDEGAPHGAGPTPTGAGIGLANTRARLERLYGLAARCEIVALPGGGTRARVAIPMPPVTSPPPAPGDSA